IRTDTTEILKDLKKGKAALLPLGGKGEDNAGYKGYDFSAFVEILSAALQGGSFLKALSGYDESGNRTRYKLGHFFMAINVEAFNEVDEFKKIAGDILRDLRNSKKDPEAKRIYTAGEKEYLAWQERKNKGAPVNKVIKQQLMELRDEFDLNEYTFPWEEKN
ncbi:MAG: Ldh family oxidoreductase, partial [Kosmotogaceae bacterium]